MNGIIVKEKCSLNFKSISITKVIAVLLVFAMIMSNFLTLTTADACERLEIAIIDSQVSDSQVLIEGIRPGVEVISINNEEDGISQIAKALEGRHNIDAIHIVSHGEAGKIFLGSSVLTGQNLEKYERQLASIGKALKENGDIFLYGCNIASGEKGEAFINKLSDYTHAELSASDNPTGSTSRGGDWILEYHTGKEQIPDLFNKEFQNRYHGLLGDITLSVEDAVVNGGGVGPGLGPELVSGEAKSTICSPGVKIYYTDKNTGAKAGQVSLFNWADPSIGGYVGISKGIFHARVDNDGYNYSDYSTIYTQYMIIEKTDYSSFNFKQAKFAFGGKMTLVVEGFRGETSTGLIEFVYSEDGVKNIILNETILTPEKFQNVDKVKITGKGYADAPGLQDVLDTGMINLCSVTLGNPIVPQITYEVGTFTESALNDGTITTTKTVTLSGDTFTAGPFTEGNHYTTANVPSGMTLTVAKNSDTQLTLSLTGTATAHENLNDISNLTISFKNAAFAGNNASAILNSTKNDMVIDFTDATDLTEYNEALAAVKESDYTTNSWTAYQLVVTANVMTVSNTQVEVDAATNAIKEAQAKLIKVVDENLAAAAKEAEELLKSTDYVDYSAVTAALTMAEGTDEEKIAKTTAINNAIKALVKKSDLTAYSEALAAVKESDYTTNSWTAYQSVVTANVMTVSNTQSEVDAATNAIKAAQAKLVKVVDANLAAAVKEAEELLKSTDYVDCSAVTAALEMAEGTDEEKIAKTTAINDAIKTLVKKSNLTAYNAALSAVKESDYTTNSWAAYQLVVTANVMTVSNTQSQVDAATNAIKAAQAKLVKVVDVNLAAAEEAAENLILNDDYVDYSAVTLALKMAEGTDEEKILKTTAINDAIKALVKKSDLTAYNAALSAVKELDYTTVSWSAYKLVVTANVMTVSNTQSQVDAATNAIKAAQAKLIKVVDANLAAAKEAAENLILIDYVDYSAVTLALKMAEGTDEEKVSKTTAINSAIKALVKKSDLTAYNAALSAVKELDYTTDSWAVYKLVVTANVMTTSNTQVEVDAATNAIKAAQAKLVKVVDENLAAAKAAAVAELNKYKTSTDYSAENWALISQRKVIGAAEINNAASIESVAAALAAAKADIDKISTIVITYSVKYDGNGNDSGSVPTDTASYTKGSYAKVMGSGNLTKSGYTFSNWNTAADGSGTSYKLNDTFAVTEDVKLYAQWSKITEAETPVLTSSNVRGTEVVNQKEKATELSVTAVVKDGGTLSYQWYLITNKADIIGDKIDEATSSKYLPSTTSSGIFGYYVVVKNTVTVNSETKTATNKSSVKEVVVIDLPPSVYSVSLNGGNLSGNVNFSVNTTQTAIQYQNYTATLNADSGYILPSNIKVVMNEATLVSGIDYIYSKATGALTIYNVSGDLSISAEGVLIPIKIYTIEFNSNGGSDVPSLTGAYGKTITLQIPTKLGYKFGGWYRDSNFATSYVSDKMGAENLVLYAKWEQMNYSINGNVKDEDNKNASGAIVKIMAGSREVAKTATDSFGNFSITGVLKGTYNLVVSNGTEQTITLTITISESNIGIGTVILPSGNKNSVVEVKPDTPDIVVDKLNDFFESTRFTQDDKNIVDSGGTVEIKLTVEKKDESGDNAAANANFIINAAGSANNVGMLFEINLSKIVTSKIDNVDIIEKPVAINELDDLLTINIPLSDDLIGKDEYVIYRYHQNEINKITQTKNSDGEYIELSSDGKYIKLHAKKFSTYAIAYSMNSSHGGSSSTVNEIKITAETCTGGRIAVSSDKKTVQIIPDEGYVIVDVLVDDKSVGATETYSFSDNKSHRISATFIKESALPYYIKNSKKVFVGFSAILNKILKYTAPQGMTVEFKENPKGFEDIKNHWGKTNIGFVTERELFLGTTDKNFSPDKGMTRAMLVTVIGRLYERSYGNVSGSTSFADADNNAYYADYLAWADENGIIKGMNGKFMPDSEVTREQMAEIMFRFAKYLDKAPKGDWVINVTYKDKAEISDWAMESAAYCQFTGLISGRDGGKFAPKAKVTRAEVSAIIERFINNFYK